MAKIVSISNLTEDDYGTSYKDHCLDIYKLYVNMADNISARRQSANSYFLTVNTSLIALMSFVQIADTPQIKISHGILSLAGIILCYLWYRIIKSYKNLNSGKFQVIQAIENILPLNPYKSEWEIVGEGKDKKLYLPFTQIEMVIPWVFIAIYAFIIIIELIVRDFYYQVLSRIAGVIFSIVSV